MRVLAVDTALEACSACVFDAARSMVLAQESAPMQRGHAEALIPLLERIVGAAGGFHLLNRVVVTTGPGSFTGLRVAISAGRTIAMALKIPCVGIGTLAAIAAPYVGAPGVGSVASVIDAKHGNIYFELVNARGLSMIEPRYMSAREAARSLGGGMVKIAGPAAHLLGQEARAVGAAFSLADPGPSPDIVWVARLGALADPNQAVPRPTYLKAVDAKPQTEGRVRRI